MSVPRDTLAPDTIQCAIGSSIIYSNHSSSNYTIKVMILEKCTGTLDIVVRNRNHTTLRHKYRVNQTPSATKIDVWGEWFVELVYGGGTGKIVYRVVIP